MTSRRDDVGGAVGRFDRRQVGKQPEDTARAAHRRSTPRDPAGQGADRDAILAGQPDVAQGRRRPLGEQELGGRTRGHRRGGIDEQRDRDVLFLDEELDEQLLQTGIDVPVELAEVVAERVVAVVGELDRLAALDAPAAALEAAPDRRAHQQEQPLELAQERLVEDGRVDLARQERLARAGRRPVGDGPLGRPTGLGTWGNRPSLGSSRWSRRYSTVGATTASRMARMTASVVMPSASPSKLRMIRCRSDGSATARMSSIETLKRPSSSA